MDTDKPDFISTNATAQSRRTNLFTYSCADLERFPYSPALEKCVSDALESGKSSARVVQWTVCEKKKKNHSDCASKDYHMAVKLSVTRRWLRLSQS